MQKDTLPENVSEQISNFRFGLFPMFYALTLIAAGMALGPGSFVFSLAVLVVWLVVSIQRDRMRSIWPAFVWIAILGFIFSMTINPHPIAIRPIAERTVCQNNIRFLLLGILNYESVHRRFPNTLTHSPTGELRHSWRVMILPFIEEIALYEQYDFTEPWDGPNNSKLASQMPEVFSCPGHPVAGQTPYKTVTDDDTAFDPSKSQTGIGIGQIQDGPFRTIALVEDIANQVNWMSPDDLTIEEALTILNSIDATHCAHDVVDDAFVRQYGSINVGFLDCRVENRTIVPDEILTSKVFTIADGFKKEIVWTGQQFVETKWRGFVILAAYVILIFLPAFFIKKTKTQYQHA